MRVLFLSPRQCWPVVSGAKLREYHFLRSLGRSWDLTYLFFAASGEEPPADAFPFCKRVVAVTKPEFYTPWKILRGLLSTSPLPIINYTSADMSAAIARELEQRKFDLVHLDSIHMMPYKTVLRAGTDAPFVYNWHNIESEVMQRYSAAQTSPLRRLYAEETARRLVKAERQILADALGHVVCSERELTALQATAPRARVAVIENGVDTAAFVPHSNSKPDTLCLLFVGAMAYHANVEASTSFVRTLWPRIRALHPQGRLKLVGTDPVPAVRALTSEPGVEVTGTVPDVRPYYAAATAAIVPLNTGGGTRLKILEAMAAGVPVISTTLGAEGLAVSHGSDILISNDEAEWLESINIVDADPARRQALVSSALKLVHERYDWEILGAKLLRTYREWLTR